MKADPLEDARMREVLGRLFEGRSLTRQEAAGAMDLLMGGGVRPEQAAAFLGALRAKRETRDELTGFAEALRARMIPVPVGPSPKPLIDTCGTGGSGMEAFNISTAVAFIAAAAGARVAKHGNRSVSGRCGSADVLEALGVRIEPGPEASALLLERVGLAFLFAPAHHPALRNVASVRRAIGVRTVLNVLGPLVNPARVTRQVIGVPDWRLARLMAEVLGELGAEEAMVVTGEDGLDELSLGGPTRVAHLRAGRVTEAVVTPEDAGLSRAPSRAVRGGGPRENAAIIESLFKNELQGPMRDIVLLNAAAALLVAGLTTGLREGAAAAAGLLASGLPWAILEELRRASR